jgi:hypothetical protein
MMEACMDALEIRDALPSVSVHNWLDPRTLVRIKLAGDFGRFERHVRSVTGASLFARLYWFPDDSVLLTSRQELTAATFASFCNYVRLSADAAVWVYRTGATMAPESPGELPATALPHEPRQAVTPSQPSRHSGHSARSSAVQEQFRAAVLGRDGRRCVLCDRERNEQELDAAHVVPHGSPSDMMREAVLTNTNDTCNGIMLCSTPCHFWFDRLHWWVGEDDTVCVTDALLSDDTLGGHFRPHVGKPLKLPVDALLPLWPRSTTWAVQRRRCVENTAKRRATAGTAKFICEMCGKPYQLAHAYSNHTVRCTAVTRSMLFTPSEAHDEDGNDSSSTGSPRAQLEAAGGGP